MEPIWSFCWFALGVWHASRGLKVGENRKDLDADAFTPRMLGVIAFLCCLILAQLQLM